MIKEKKITVVVPAFNEGHLINKTVLTIPSYVDYVIAVDDSSTDCTFEILTNIEREGLIIVNHKVNMGVGGAIVSGYKQALLLDSDIVCVMAGDNQMDPDDLVNVIQPVIDGIADYSKGNRFLDRSILLRMPHIRLFGNFIFSIMSCIASGYYNTFDTQCGYTAINKVTLQKLDLNNIFPRYGFPTDLLAKLNNINAKIKDVPVKTIYSNEQSGIKVLPYTKTLIYLLIKLFISRQLLKLNKKEMIKKAFIVS